MTKARVFISCGQLTPTEKSLGKACYKHFKRRKFSPYFADEVQSFEGLTNSIFNRLKNSEYAIFIDCKREEVRKNQYRGSVFVNQELAIAAFCPIPIENSRIFHEIGLKREGVANYLLAKPIPFNNKGDLMNKLRKETKDWENDWTNELTLKYLRVAPNYLDTSGQYRDWYHLQVKNNHHSEYARNCVAFLLKVKDLSSGKEDLTDNFELVWSGTGLCNRHLLPKRTAEIDAFHIVRGHKVINFRHRPSTSSAYGIKSLPSGNYLLTYIVVSENFHEVQQTFKLEFGGTYQSIRFYQVK